MQEMGLELLAQECRKINVCRTSKNGKMAKWGKNGANCFQSSETFDTISLSRSLIFFVMCK